MADKKNYMPSIKLAWQISMIGIAFYSAVYAIMAFIDLTLLTTLLSGNTLLVLIITIILTLFAEFFYKVVMKAAALFWDSARNINSETEDIEREMWDWRGEVFLLATVFVGIGAYFFAQPMGPESSTVPEKQLIVVMKSKKMTALQKLHSILWEIWTASMIIITLSGVIGVYYSVRHRFLPSYICHNEDCKEDLRVEFEFCPYCNEELGPMYSKYRRLKKALGIATTPSNKYRESD